ncbi:hypothetical protein PTKIN_Ptkin07bG0060600 [Pterospermum kingtungense]
MQIFPKKVIKFWNGWEVRALVVLSLTLQVILIVFGSYRKRTTRAWIRILVWSAYMSADWVATVALGNLATLGGNSGNESSKENSALQSFWAPFLLLHLGGPDTITAYSLEDNELWQRHFLGLLVEAGVAIYVFLRSCADTALTYIAIPVFIAGVIKYGERTWVLRSSSTKHFRDSLLGAPDPGPDYVLQSKKTDDVEMEANVASGGTDYVQSKRRCNDDQVEVNVSSDRDPVVCMDNIVCQAYLLFEKLEYFVADLILGYHDRKYCRSIICKKSPEEAFGLVEVELGFLYDMLYTKASLVYSRFGIYLRCISSLCSFSAFVTFLIIINNQAYSPVDIYITYSLLIGALVLELYAMMILIYSDWTKLWLLENNFHSLKRNVNGKRWSRTMANYNLINVCLKQEATMSNIGVEIFGWHQNVTWQHVDSQLRELIFHKLQERSNGIDSLFDVNLCKKLLDYRGDFVLGKMNCLAPFEWCTVGVEFDHSLLLWHIATELCYNDDAKRLRESNDLSSLKSLNRYSKISKWLSDYMLYLLVMCPSMLPKGIGEIRYRDTCAEAIRFFNQTRDRIQSEVDKACEELFQVDTSRPPEEVKGDVSKSVLFYGCSLAKQLQSLRSLGQMEDWGIKKKWEMMNEVWVELLAYAAVHCSWKEHAQQLRKGGEFLSHVCLLMAHLGLSQQYQTQQQYFTFNGQYHFVQ